MKKLICVLGVYIFVFNFLTGCNDSSSTYPECSLSYDEIENEVGGHSNFSDDKKEDLFNTKYKNHWFTWEGVVVLAKANEASINIDDFGTQDLRVDFADSKAGYNLTIGDRIKVRFLMKSLGGSFLPFSGEEAEIIR